MWRRFIMFCPHQNSLLCIKIWIDVLPLKLFNSVLKLLFFQESHVSIMRTVRNRDEWVSLNIVIKRWIILKSNTFSSGGLDVTCIVILLQYFNVNNRVTKERMEKINFLNKFWIIRTTKWSHNWISHTDLCAINDSCDKKNRSCWRLDERVTLFRGSFAAGKWFIAGSTFDVVWISLIFGWRWIEIVRAFLKLKVCSVLATVSKRWYRVIFCYKEGEKGK